MGDEMDDQDLDDPGGVPFDDDFEAEPPPDDEGARGGGALAYDDGAEMQSRGIGYPSSTPVGMIALRDYVRSRFGGSDLGCLSRPPRPMRGGSSPSMHNWGMAWDWRWAGPGPGRATANSVIEFCLDNAAELGVQAVHDYEQCRYWKSYNGWNQATSSSSSGFGQSWAQWLHVERTWAGANDRRGINDILGRKADADDDRRDEDDGRLKLPPPLIKAGDAGAHVARLQDFLRMFDFADFRRSDGEFGPRTQTAMRKAQQTFTDKGWYSLRIDGEYGPKSCEAALRCVAESAKR